MDERIKRLIKKKEECCGCGVCAAICPVGAIRMVQDHEGFFYPCIDHAACIECGLCVDGCVLKNRQTEEHANSYFGVQAKNNKIRYSSSSGGFFSILAEYVLSRQGIVYGAGYDSEMNVLHKGVQEIYQMEQIKRTKYVQSNMEGIYHKIQKHLENGRLVLFCGTPCQTHALKSFLQKSYEKLITVDLICYGVPSPGIWKKYVNYIERKHGGKMTDFSFRDKRNGDNGHICSYKIDGKEYVGSLYNDKYCMLYFMNLILRPSCHKCIFCSVERDSDFTIGDFWGIENVRQDMDDGMGTSVVITHTLRAEKIWNSVKDDAEWFACKIGDVAQPRLTEPTNSARWRRIFMLAYRVIPFSFMMRLMDIALWLRGKLD